jgi:hypothetical protein
MNASKISLLKTLCAMRWISLLNGNKELAKVIEQNQKAAEAA